jgi:inorganic pyrophosphatase
MGSDLFGSFAEASCAALVIGATSQDLVNAGWGALMYPLTISSFGIFVCLACSFLATDIRPVREEKDVEKVRNELVGMAAVHCFMQQAHQLLRAFCAAIGYCQLGMPSTRPAPINALIVRCAPQVLKIQLLSTSVGLTGAIFVASFIFLPSSFSLTRVGAPLGTHFEPIIFNPVKAWGCVSAGLWAGCLVGFITEVLCMRFFVSNLRSRSRRAIVDRPQPPSTGALPLSA